MLSVHLCYFRNMHKKLFGLSLVIALFIGLVLSLQQPSLVAAEYACGTYSSGVYASDCTDTTITPTTPTASAGTSGGSSSATANSNTGSGAVTSTNTDTAPGTSTTTPKSSEVPAANSTTSQPLNWWPWIVGALGVIAVLTVVITATLRRRNASR